VFPAASSALYVEAARAGVPYLFFERGGALMAQRFDASRAKVTDDPFLVAPQVGLGGSALALSASQTGTLVFATGQANLVTTQLAWMDRTGKALGDMGAAGDYLDFSLSPDGKRLMVARTGTSPGEIDLWLMDVATHGMTRFTLDPETDRWPVWSPDGTRVVYTRSQSRIYEKSISGTGERALTGVVGMPMDWSRDGRSILVRSSDGDLWTLTDGKPVRVTHTSYDETQAQFSPDGKWIAFVSNESRRAEVYVQAFPSAGEKFPISVAGGTQPRWRADGAELFYMAPDGKLMAVSVKTSDGFEHASPTALFEIQGVDASINTFDYFVTGDGQRFLVRTPAKGTKRRPVVVMTNWLAFARKWP
jgi:dipeptidyl aminopeptidase/acylaminoacyl peptidase